MATQKLKQMGTAIILGVFASLALLLTMEQQAALSAPLHADPVLSVNKTSLNNWNRRIKLVFTNTVTETLLDFPTLVVLNSSRISYSLTQNNGQDIRFVDPDGTLLPHEIEQWDESDTSYVWVKVPQIDASSSSDFIWLYYGNPDAADTQQPAAVWNDDYRGVWHLNNNTYADSTTPANSGSSITAPTTITGQIGSAQFFSDTTVLTGVHINVGSADNLDNLFTNTVASPGATLSAWINPFGFGGGFGGSAGFGRILDKALTRSADNGWSFQLDGTVNGIRFERGRAVEKAAWGAPFGAIVLNQWQHVAVTYVDGNDTVPQIYIDGVPQTIKETDFSSPSGDFTSDADRPLWIGNFSKPEENDRQFEGRIDEVRVAKGQRSAAWLLAEYRTTTDTFIDYRASEPLTVSSQEAVKGGLLTYTLTVSNEGTVATDVVVTDTLPADAEFVSAGEGGVYLAGSNAVSWTIPSIGNGSAQDVTFVVTSCQTLLHNKDYRAIIASSSGVTFSVGPSLFTFLVPPTLTPTFETSALTVTVGSTLAVTDASRSNGGPFVNYRWDFGDGSSLADGITATHTYAASGSYTITLTLTDTCNYSATATVPVQVVLPALTISKSAQPEPVLAGQTLTYTVVVTNSGPGQAQQVTITDTLPTTGVTFDADSVTIQPNGVGVSGTLPVIAQGITLQPDERVTVTYRVTVAESLSSGTILTNTVAVTSLQTPQLLTAVVTSTVTNLPRLTITKDVEFVEPLVSGDRLTYTVVVSNSSDATATGAVISDTLPSGLTLITDTLTLLPSGAGTLDSGPPLLVTDLTITGNERITLTFAVTLDAGLTGSVITNTASVTSAEQPAAMTATAVVTVANYDLAISKSAQPEPVFAGQTLTYTVVVTNSGPGQAQQVTITDTLPTTGVTFDAASVTIQPGSVGGSSGSLPVIAQGITLQPDEQVTVTYRVTVAESLSTGTILTNTVAVTSLQTPQLLTAVVTSTVTNLPRLTITKEVDFVEPLVSGDRLTYTVVVSNSSDATATGAVISDTLPSGLTLITDTLTLLPPGAGTLDSGPPLLVTDLTITGNERITLTFAVTLDAGLTGSVITNTASVTSAEQPAAMTATAVVTVANYDLAISKSAQPEPVFAGQTLTYTVVVTNSGPGQAQQVTITDTLPTTGVTFHAASVTIQPGSVGGSSGTLPVIAHGITLEPGQQVTVTYRVTVAYPLTNGLELVNTASVTSAETTAAVSATAVVTVANYDLAISKTAEPEPFVAGQVVSYTVVVSNISQVAVASAVSDTLPEILEGTGWRCEGIGVSCLASTGSGNLNETISLPAGSRLVYVLTGTLSADARGTVVNSATVSSLVTPPEVVTSNNSAAVTSTIQPEVELTIGKSGSAEMVAAGEVLTYTVLVTNNGSSQAQDVTITDTLPTTGVTFDAASVSIQPGSVGGSSGTLPVIAQGITLEPGQQVTVTYRVTVAYPLTNGLELVNTASVTSAETTAAVNATAVVTVANYDLAISKTAEPEPFVAGQVVSYTVVVSNISQVAVASAVSDTLPEILAGTSWRCEGIGASCPSGTGLGNLNETINLPANGQLVYVLTGTLAADARGTVVNSATVSSLVTPPEVVTSNNSAAVTSTIQPDVELTIAKSASAESVAAGQVLTYTVVVTNTGSSQAQQVTITDTLPTTGVTFDAASVGIEPGSVGGSSGTLPVIAQGITLEPGQHVTVTYRVTVAYPLTNGLELVNTASVTSVENLVPETAIVTTTVVATPAVQLDKTGPSTATVGEQVVFTFTVTNSGDSLLDVVQVVDDVAGSAAFVDGDSNNNSRLDLTESWRYTAAYAIAPDDPSPLINTAVVTAVDGAAQVVTATALHSTDLAFSSVLTLVKYGPDNATVGQTIEFTFAVQHTPESDGASLDIVKVVDDVAGEAGFVDGDDNNSGKLEAGEQWRYRVEYLVTPRVVNPLVNTAQVSALDPNNSVITAQASHSTTLSGFTPRLFVDNDGPPAARLQETVGFTFTVVNVDLVALVLFDLGPIALADIGDGSPIAMSQVTDTLLATGVYVSGDANNNGLLDGAEAWIYTANHTIGLTDVAAVPNTAFATGFDQEGDPLRASDTHLLDLIFEPRLQIISTGPFSAATGETIAVTAAVSHRSNSDNSAVAGLSAENNFGGTATLFEKVDNNGNGKLDGGDVWRYVVSYTVSAGYTNPLVNTTTVQGLDLDNEVVTATDTLDIELDTSNLIPIYLPLITKK